jgi:nucleoid-associated protein YgaU
MTTLPDLPGLGTTPPPGNDLDSRYAGTPTVTRRLADGRTLTYLQRRFIPDSDQLVAMAWHEVEAGDRLDALASRYYGNSLLWWRIADANGVQDDPDELLVPGRRLRIPHPEGIGGVPL